MNANGFMIKKTNTESNVDENNIRMNCLEIANLKIDM